jgi:hypothetical protein
MTSNSPAAGPHLISTAGARRMDRTPGQPMIRRRLPSRGFPPSEHGGRRQCCWEYLGFRLAGTAGHGGSQIRLRGVLHGGGQA